MHRSEFDPPAYAVEDAVRRALAEDLGMLGDITSTAVIAEDSFVVAVFRSREEGVIAGAACVDAVLRLVDPTIVAEWELRDGTEVGAGATIATVRGSTHSVLVAERSALNFLCHLSGIASLTRRYVRAARGKARIIDTRKTLPGLRSLQKAAVRAGGGSNHRESLSDAVLLKDNHLAVLGITRAVERARSRWPGRMIEVECESIEQVAEARDAGATRIMLDNMSPEEARTAIVLLEGAVPVEVSGGITLETVGQYVEVGADFISVGALTHSARVLDIGLDFL